MRGILFVACLCFGAVVFHPGDPPGTADSWLTPFEPLDLSELAALELLPVPELVPVDPEPAETPSPVVDADDEALPVLRVWQPCTA